MSFSVNTISAESTAVISRQAIGEQQLQINRVKAGTVQENGSKVEDSSAVTATFGTSADKIEISPEGRKALEQIYAARASKAKAAQTAAAEAAAMVPGAEQAAPKAEIAKPSQTVSGPKAAELVKSAAEAPKSTPEEAEKASKPAADSAQVPAPEVKPKAAEEKTADMPKAKPEVSFKEEAEKYQLELPGAGTTDNNAETDGVSSYEIQNMSVSELRTAVTEGTITAAQMDDELSRRKSAEQQEEQQADKAQEAMNEAINSMKDMNKAAENMNTFSTVKQYAAVAQALA